MATIKTPEDVVRWRESLLSLFKRAEVGRVYVGDEVVKKAKQGIIEMRQIPDMPPDVLEKMYELYTLALQIQAQELEYRLEQAEDIRKAYAFAHDCECPWPRQEKDYVM